MKKNRKTKKRCYFDYNIYEKIRKDGSELTNTFFDNYDIFLSVAHIEEYYKAYKNDVNNENKENLQKLKNIMVNNSKNRIILNPQKKGRIIAKSQTFDECFNIIQKYDTRKVIDEHGERLNRYQNKRIKELRENDKEAMHNSALDKEKIWDRPEVVKGIEDFQKFYQDYFNQSVNSLLPVYGYYGTAKTITELPRDFTLKKFCFKNTIPEFKLLECVVEYLHKHLEECGYFRDKELRKTKSGIHDVSHSIYATYCNYFVTQDSYFRKRTEAIYYFLGIDTEVLSLDDFCGILPM